MVYLCAVLASRIPWQRWPSLTDVRAGFVRQFSTDFGGTLPSEIAPGTATLTGVQGYAGLGPTGNQFSGNFLRSATGNTVTRLQMRRRRRRKFTLP